MKAGIKRLLLDEEGQGLVEYAFILMLVALAVVGAVEALGGRVVEFYEAGADAFP